jgi:hypothetical protein
VQVVLYYVLIVVPLFGVGLVVFYPDPEYGNFLTFLGAIELGAMPEMALTTVVTTIIMAALPERFRRPLW